MAEYTQFYGEYNPNDYKKYYRKEYGKYVPVGQYYDPNDEGRGGGKGRIFIKNETKEPAPAQESGGSGGGGGSPAPEPDTTPAPTTTEPPTAAEKRAEVTKPAEGLESTIVTQAPVTPVAYLTGNTSNQSRFLNKKKDKRSLFGV